MMSSLGFSLFGIPMSYERVTIIVGASIVILYVSRRAFRTRLLKQQQPRSEGTAVHSKNKIITLKASEVLNDDEGTTAITTACSIWEGALLRARAENNITEIKRVRTILAHLYAALGPAGGLTEEAKDAALLMHPLANRYRAHSVSSMSAVSEEFMDAVDTHSVSGTEKDGTRSRTLSTITLDAKMPNFYEEGRMQAMQGLVKCRRVRVAQSGCVDEIDFLARVYMLRRSFKYLLSQKAVATYFREQGLVMMKYILELGNSDPISYELAYNDLMDYLENTARDDPEALRNELAVRGIKDISFYDIGIDFALMDSFDDLNSPPSAVVSVMQNSWIPQSVKLSAVSAAVGALIRTREATKGTGNFIRRFYETTKLAAPVLAVGFLGPPSELKTICTKFKDSIELFIKDVFAACVKPEYNSELALSQYVLERARGSIEALGVVTERH